jgi:cytochrome c-type biogenesis protein CcmH/NrfG
VNDRLAFRVGDLMGLDEACGHLSPQELEGLVEGRLDRDRLRELEAHAADCAACSELIDDLEQFRTLVAKGLTVSSERKAFEASDAEVRARVGLLRLPRRWFRPLFVWLTPAVAFTFLLAVWFWPSGPRMIAEVERVPLQPPPAVRGLALSETWDRLEGPWKADDMDEAARILSDAVARNPDRPDLLFYLGVARLRAGDAEAALEALSRSDELESAAPSEHTRWMLAAALERNGRADEACAALRSVARIGGVRAEAAREIVEASCR